MIDAFSLSNKVALVTGGSRGIGSGIVEVFLEAGATVVVNSLTEKYSKPFVDRLDDKYPGKVFGVLADATSSSGARSLVEKAYDVAGPIDVLVNGVGDARGGGSLVPLPGKDGTVYSDDDISTVLGLNLMSAIYCMRAAAPGMLERRSGKIISLIGSAADYGAAYNSIYAAGKGGVAALTKSLALDWAPYGVTVNAISPGVYLDYNVMPKAVVVMLEDAFLPKVPLGRLGKFHDIGLLALYIASRAGDYMTGQVVTLDGGLGDYKWSYMEAPEG